MRKWFFIPAVAFVSFACSGEKSAIERVLKEVLIDPASAIIGKVVISEDSLQACITYNSKNKFGGYVGQRIAKLKKLSEQWTIKDTDVYAFSCTNAGFKEADKLDALFHAPKEAQAAAEELEALLEALSEAREVAVSAIQQGLDISREDAISSLKKGKCSSNFKLFETAYVNRAETAVNGEDTTFWSNKIAQLLKTFTEGHCNPIRFKIDRNTS